MKEYINDRESKIWGWARDAYWIAFVAAYPNFPRATWPMWDLVVQFDGTFIKEWVEHHGSNRNSWRGAHHSMGEEMLARFCQHVLFVL